MPRLFHRVADDLADEVIGSSFRQTSNLSISETMIDKSGMPPAPLLLTVGIVTVSTLGVAQVLHPNVASGVELFGKANDDGVTLA